MRILLVSHGLPPESVGGVEQHVDGLARALIELGHDVHVYARTGRTGPAPGTLVDDASPVPGDPATPDRAPYPVTRVVYRHEGLDTLLGLYRRDLLDAAFERFLAGHDAFEVAHVHHLTGVSTGVVSVLARRGVPCVLTLHDYWLMCPRGQMWHRDGSVTDAVEPARCADCLRPAYGRFVAAGTAGEAAVEQLHRHALEVLGAATVLVAPSPRVAPPFVALGVAAGDIRVVENGVDTDALTRLPLPDVAAARGPLRVGYLGTLIPSKGLDVLVRAVRRLPRGLVTLSIRGNSVPYHGDESFLTRVFAQLTPEDSVTYGGPYRTSELPAILGVLDVVVAPALWNEAFGLTVREALAAGRPVVVSRIGGLQDAIRDGVDGRWFPPGDDAALAQILRGMAEDREALARMVRSTRRGARVRGFDAMARDLLRVYGDAVALARDGATN